MYSLLWPGHFNFLYSCVGYWKLLYWFGDPLSCQASGHDQWKVCIYSISSRSPICQEGSNSWNRIFVVYQLFEFQVQVGDHWPCGGKAALDFKWRGCSRENVGKNQNPQKIRLPAKPKNIMGPLLTSKAKKKETHKPVYEVIKIVLKVQCATQ